MKGIGWKTNHPEGLRQAGEANKIEGRNQEGVLFQMQENGPHDDGVS